MQKEMPKEKLCIIYMNKDPETCHDDIGDMKLGVRMKVVSSTAILNRERRIAR